MDLAIETVKELRKVLTGCCYHTCKEPIEVCKECNIRKIDNFICKFEVDI